ncbi:MAG TPA: hypothetical protein VGQ28_03370 [Thermoanaerobaculia bacterium]|nr:hypothetical protein [Thermoanaerobaculia bacterium]
MRTAAFQNGYFADLDLEACKTSTARRLFWRDRRPELYRGWL